MQTFVVVTINAQNATIRGLTKEEEQLIESVTDSFPKRKKIDQLDKHLTSLLHISCNSNE